MDARLRKLSDYEPLKIHIEGGHITGYYNKVGDELWGEGDNAADWDYYAERANQTDLTILGKYITLQFPLNDADTEENKGMNYYLTSKNNIEEILDEFFGDVFVKFVEKLYQGLLDGENEKLFDSLDLCVGASCEWCKNYPQCVKRLKEKKSISLLPYLTGYAQEYVKKIQMPDEIEAFFEQMQTPEMAEMLSGNRTWNYFLRDNETMRLHKEAAPYTAESVYAAGYHFKGVRSFELSNWQDVTLILTAHKDVATSRVYALGYYVNLRKKQESVVLNIAKGMTEEAYVQNARDFVRGLYRFLCNVSNKGEYSLQGFVMDSYERNNLEEVLYDLLERPDTSMEDMEKFFNNSEKRDGFMRASADVALKNDFLVLYAFDGHHVCDIEILRGSMSDDVIPFIENFLKRNGVRKENFTYDSNGLGLWLSESAAFKNKSEPFNNKSAATDSRLWNNLKSECAEKFVKAIKAGEFSISEDVLNRKFYDKKRHAYTVKERLLEERRAIKRKDGEVARFEIISKQQMKLEVGHSPDFIEALFMIMHLFTKRKSFSRKGFDKW